MKNSIDLPLLVSLVIFCLFTSCKEKKDNTPKIAEIQTKKPNIIFILTDDLGYGDVGTFFQNQRKNKNDRSEPWAMTPNLDNMAAEGAILTDHYAAAPVCAPSRTSFLTGLSQGHANIRDNQFDKALADNHTVGNLLQRAGYATSAIGKWGLQGSSKWSEDGDSWPAHPLNRGFDYFYGYMRHRDGHEHYPVEGVYRGAKEVYENRNEVSKGLDKCYTGDLWTAVAKKWIVEQTSAENNNQPFFMFLAYDTPHAVTEIPTQAYPKGGGLNGGLQWTGKPGNIINTASGEVDSWIHPDYVDATYDHDKNMGTPEIAWPNVYMRYATSTRRIDDAVGDILQLLSDLNIDENTLVIFSSDNGPSIESYLPDEDFEANFFNSFGPFDGIKRDVMEGGERVPTIARWPSKIPAKSVVASPSAAYDWLPTFLDAAGLPAPANSDGVSLLPALTKNGEQPESLVYVEYNQEGKSPEYDEFSENNRGKLRNQMQMIRMGDIVGLRYDIKSADDDFEMYNVIKDPQQSNNLIDTTAVSNLNKKMKERVLQVRITNSTAPRPYDEVAIPAIPADNLKKGLKWMSYNTGAPWLSKVDTLKILEEGVATTLDVSEIKSNENDLIVYEGYLNILEEGDYTFFLSATNNTFLRIHDANVIDADYGYQAGTILQNNIKLKVGYHPIQLYYMKNNSDQNSLDLQWKGPSFEKTEVPMSVFFRP